MSEAEQTNALEGVAVVGMAGRFPGARSVDEFWKNLCDGVESISIFSEEEVVASGVPEALARNPAYVKAGFRAPDTDRFDAQFFGFTPREAEFMDPQHRVFLECAWEALEDAGYDSERYPGSVGVFAGCGLNNYILNNLVFNRRAMAMMGPYQAMLGNDKDYLTTRVSYKLNLKGPSLSIQTACSTSLVAIQVAFQSLLNYQCDMALAGGVSLHSSLAEGYLYAEGQILSTDGHCRAFDRDASGTALGEGAGIVVLKRLEDALEDGDRIYAVVRGAAVNNDGAAKVGYTAPSVEGQVAVIATAQALAGFDPATISYVETHGTGTPLGDAIEIAALTQAFRGVPSQSCRIGSVKPNIGHLDAGAGVAGFIKTVLALYRGLIPPSVNCKSPNPRLNIEATPFYVNTTLSEWKRGDAPRRAGVSSFGIGGTNAHVVLEEAPAPVESDPPRPWELIALSARSPSALENATRNLAEHLRAHPDFNLGDVAFTLQTGRRAFPHRRFLVCRDVADASQALSETGSQRLLTSKTDSAGLAVGFMFTGQGSQYVDMGKGLYETEPVFREAVDSCAEILKPHLGQDLRAILYPTEGATEENSRRLEQTAIAQPAIFTIEYALARLCAAWGLVPTAMIGHSIGEYTAACIAGVFTLESALELVATRGRLMQELPGGSMLAVPLAESDVAARIDGSLSLAAVNAPSFCVVSGPHESIDGFERRLRERGVECRRLHTSHAFHSEMMDPILEPFRRVVEKARPQPPAMRFVSNLTGKWIADSEACDPSYWVDHLRRTVRFSDGVRTLLDDGDAGALVEVGPGNTLCSLARQQRGVGPNRAIIPLVRHPREPQPDPAYLMSALGRLWLVGVEIDWARLHEGKRRRRVSLPTYPFERQRYWIEAVNKPAVSEVSDMSDGSRTANKAEETTTPSASAALYSRPDLPVAYAPPRNDTEETLAEIWRNLLGIEPIGIHDNFFDLGGHSLLASQVISRVRETVRVDLPMRGIFEVPTIAGLARAIESVRTGEMKTTLQAPPLERISREGRPPLSFAQRRMWFLHQWDPSSPAYNVPLAFTIRGTVDVDLLRRSLAVIHDRHETLRTAFAEEDGSPVLEISETVEPDLNVVDLTGLEESERQEALHRSIREDMLRPFDLSRAPLMRTTSFKTGADRWVVFFKSDHVVSDGWSLGVLIRELSEIYSALSEGEPSPLPELPVQYRDYADWQNRWLRDETLEAQLEFWKERLAGELPILELPADRPRPAAPSYRGATLGFSLSRELTESLHKMSKRRGSTLFMTLMTGFNVLLHRYTGQDDIIVGSPTANRIRPEIEGLIGLFINTLAFRTDLSGNPSFEALLQRVRELTLASYGHQDLPFEQLVEALQPKRDPSHHPIFQTMFALQNAPFPPLRMGNLQAESMIVDHGGAQIDFVIAMWEKDGVLHGAADYSTDLFERETVARMIEHFETLLASAAAEPSLPISDLELLTESEREALLAEGRGPRPDYPRDVPVQDLFEKEAARNPRTDAVRWRDQALTYDALNRRSNRLARRLRAMGVGPNVLVAICLERCPDTMVSILGILKAGGAYVPLDPEYPKERLAFVIEDTKAPVVLTHDRLVAGLPDHGAQVLRLDAEWESIASESDENLPASSGPEDLAYVIYTSGSTGRPKGVRITHRNLICSTEAYTFFYSRTVKRSLLLFSYAFDGSVAGIFRPLVHGGTVVLPEEGDRMDPNRLVELIHRHGVTYTICLPSLYSVILEAGDKERLASFEHVEVGGEACTRELVNRHYTILPNTLLSNAYGPTEATVWCTGHVCRPAAANVPVPIGKPIANYETYVLDSHNRLVPTGVAGELFVGGDGLAPGYLNRPDLTAERFVPHPFDANPQARLYKTGDVVRRASDGSIEFLGRIDNQVKIRGFRIELGEIESAMLRCPGVEDAVVLAREDVPGDKRLVGYAKIPECSPDDSARIRAHLRDTLPAYMVPAALVLLDAFPLMPNGKVDRKSLPAADGAEADQAEEYVAPRTPIEELVASTWGEVLGVEKVGIYDDFFNLGGHSLLATQVIARLAKSPYRVQVPVRQIFDASRVVDFATLVTRALLEEEDDEDLRKMLEELNGSK
ncbi:amino acid adenylation domain-containing protein [Candidatus Sumerlaeota bacterium]|nr:amino acid adenylation domain-containing protein [Candidatus Sumerlaeota bacterium]